MHQSAPSRSIKLLAGALLTFGLMVAALVLPAEYDQRYLDVATWAGVGLGGALALAAAGSSLVNLYRDAAARRGVPLALGLGTSLVGLALFAWGMLIVFSSTAEVARGRQLRRRGRVLLPPIQKGDTWLGSGIGQSEWLDVPAGLALQWRENGRTEHASVASFARLTLDLMALGAPPALVAAANQDALDEIRHTEACFELAHSLDGLAESPGAFPEAQRAHTLPRWRTLALAQLAVLSLVDGALHEGVSARLVAKLARRCAHPTIGEILKQIAADEGRHAAHGWDVLAWCLEQGGAPVAYALSGAVRSLPGRLHSNLPEAATGGDWEAWGIHGHALEQAVYLAARADVTERVQQLVARALATAN